MNKESNQCVLIIPLPVTPPYAVEVNLQGVKRYFKAT